MTSDAVVPNNRNATQPHSDAVEIQGVAGSNPAACTELPFEVVAAPAICTIGHRRHDAPVAAVIALKPGESVRIPRVTGREYGALRQTLSFRIPRHAPGMRAAIKTVGEHTYITLKTSFLQSGCTR